MRKENIYEWLYYYRMKDEEALNTIIDYFRPMVYSIANNRLPKEWQFYITMDDYLAMANTLLVEVLDSYRDDIKVKFEVFYYQCLLYRTIDVARVIFKMNKRQMDYVQLDSRVSEDNKYYISEYIYDSSKVNLNTFVLESEQVELYFKQAKKELSETDYFILVCKYQGYSIREISEMLHISTQAVHYHMKNIQKWFLLH